MRYLLATFPRECGYATQPNPMCHRTSNLKDDNIHRSVRTLSRNWCPGGDLAIWNDMMFGGELFLCHTSTCIRAITWYFCRWLLLAVAPINVTAGGATDDCLLHICMCMCCCITATIGST